MIAGASGYLEKLRSASMAPLNPLEVALRAPNEDAGAATAVLLFSALEVLAARRDAQLGWLGTGHAEFNVEDLLTTCLSSLQLASEPLVTRRVALLSAEDFSNVLEALRGAFNALLLADAVRVAALTRGCGPGLPGGAVSRWRAAPGWRGCRGGGGGGGGGSSSAAASVFTPVGHSTTELAPGGGEPACEAVWAALAYARGPSNGSGPVRRLPRAAF